MGDRLEIRLRAVTKSYGRSRVLGPVSTTFRAGEAVLLTGPNGAGKSTLLQLLALRASPSSGAMDVNGAEIDRARDRARVGFAGHEPMLYGELSGRENLQFFAACWGVPAERVDGLLSTFDCSSFCDRRVNTYSQGQRQRVSLIRCVMHDPELLLLDEPFSGLDQEARGTLLAHFGKLAEGGTGLVVATHHADLLSQVVNRRVHLEAGRIAG